MRSADEWQEYEARQQRLVEEIINTLHQKTREDEKYVEFFCKMEICILQNLNGWTIRNPDTEQEFIRLISGPISKFTSSSEERELLLTRVAEKILNSVSSKVGSIYSAKQLKDEIASK